MKENVHRGAHALTGLMFAALVIMFSYLNDRLDSDFLQFFYICITLRHLYIAVNKLTMIYGPIPFAKLVQKF